MTAPTIPGLNTMVLKPGVYDGMPEDVYHSDPVPSGSLSSSGARKLLPPSCPALFKHEQDNPPPPKKTFDYGTAAHRLVLGAGPGLSPVDHDSWRTNDAKAQAADIRAEGKVPLLRADYEQVKAMAKALREHPVASTLFNPANGRPEQSLFWVDDKTGVWRRARLDWLPNPGQGRVIVPDYKTAHSVALDDLQRAIHQFGYHQQSAWYIDAVRALGLAGPDAAFVFVTQQKTPPYLVTVIQLDPVALQVGRYLNRQAIDLYAECRRSGRWPGFSDDIEVLPLPAYVERQFANEPIW